MLTTTTPILGINIETERNECFNKIIKNMARWESNLEFSVGANSKLPSTHAPTEKVRKSKGIYTPRFPHQVFLRPVV